MEPKSHCHQQEMLYVANSKKMAEKRSLKNAPIHHDRHFPQGFEANSYLHKQYAEEVSCARSNTVGLKL
jgi:hypothetical protein